MLSSCSVGMSLSISGHVGHDCSLWYKAGPVHGDVLLIEVLEVRL